MDEPQTIKTEELKNIPETPELFDHPATHIQIFLPKYFGDDDDDDFQFKGIKPKRARSVKEEEEEEKSVEEEVKQKETQQE